jgi:CHAP domain-containing protein
MSTAPHVRAAITAAATTACLALLLSVLAVLVAVPSASASSTPALVVRGCNAYTGAKTLGTTYTDTFVKIYACGVRPSWDGAKTGTGSVVRPYAGSTTYYRGYQCIELVARYLQARYGALPGVANGAQAVDRYAAAYPTKFVKIANGTAKKAPVRGDVLSLSTKTAFSDVGHTGIVISSSLNKAGTGTIKLMEQNFGGTTGAKGYHTYTVTAWRVKFAAMPHIKWLHAR